MTAAAWWISYFLNNLLDLEAALWRDWNWCIKESSPDYTEWPTRIFFLYSILFFRKITWLIRWIPFVYYYEPHCNKNKSLLSNLKVLFCYELRFGGENRYNNVNISLFMSFIKAPYKHTYIRYTATVREKDCSILQIKNPIMLVYYLFKVMLHNGSALMLSWCSMLIALN